MLDEKLEVESIPSAATLPRPLTVRSAPKRARKNSQGVARDGADSLRGMYPQPRGQGPDSVVMHQSKAIAFPGGARGTSNRDDAEAQSERDI